MFSVPPLTAPSAVPLREASPVSVVPFVAAVPYPASTTAAVAPLAISAATLVSSFDVPNLPSCGKSHRMLISRISAHSPGSTGERASPGQRKTGCINPHDDVFDRDRKETAK